MNKEKVKILEVYLLQMLRAKWSEYEVDNNDEDFEPYPYEMWLDEIIDSISNMIDMEYKSLEEKEYAAYCQ